MRWERLFGELEGHAEHAHLEERDALVADLREGEWASRSWLDGLQAAEEVEVDVRDVGVLTGRVQFANSVLIHLVGATADHVIAVDAVRWARGGTRSRGLAPESVASRLGWGHIFRELQAEADFVRMTLVDALVLEGRIGVVGQDFVRLSPASGRERDVPVRALRVVTVGRDGPGKSTAGA
jgi:hypothetical protein